MSYGCLICFAHCTPTPYAPPTCAANLQLARVNPFACNLLTELYIPCKEDYVLAGSLYIFDLQKYDHFP